MYDRPMAISGGSAGACGPSKQWDAEEAIERASMISSFKPLGPPTNGRGEIASALDAQEKVTHELMEVAHALAKKLQPVLAPRPEADGAGTPNEGYGSSLANCVQQNTDRVRSASRLLSTLIRDLAI